MLHVSMSPRHRRAARRLQHPGRTSVDLSVESLLRLLDQCPIWSASRRQRQLPLLPGLLRQAQDRIFVMSGEDALTLPLLSVGPGGDQRDFEPLSRPGQRRGGGVRTRRPRMGKRRHFALLPVHRAFFLSRARRRSRPHSARRPDAARCASTAHASQRGPGADARASHARIRAT